MGFRAFKNATKGSLAALAVLGAFAFSVPAYAADVDGRGAVDIGNVVVSGTVTSCDISFDLDFTNCTSAGNCWMPGTTNTGNLADFLGLGGGTAAYSLSNAQPQTATYTGVDVTGYGGSAAVNFDYYDGTGIYYPTPTVSFPACDPTCGDGSVDSPEQCDDGGTTAGDGCDASCNVETGWSCAGEPSACLQDMTQDEGITVMLLWVGVVGSMLFALYRGVRSAIV